MAKKRKTMAEDALELTTFGVAGGMGALTMGAVGAAAPAAAPFMAGSAAGLGIMSGFTPTIATIKAGGHVLGGVADLQKQVKRVK